jgi:hypothetical protein
MRNEQERMLAFLRTAWDLLHEESDTTDLQRGFLLAFDVRAVCWRTDHTPRWVVLRGWDELVQGALTGNVSANMLYDGDKTLEGEIIESLEPAIEREIGWLSKKSGHRMGRMSTLQMEKDLFLSGQQGDVALRTVSHKIRCANASAAPGDSLRIITDHI